MGLNKADILAKRDREPTRVVVPGWGVVHVLPLSGRDRDELEAWQRENSDGVGMRAQIAARCLCDEDGAVFDWTEDEVEALGDKLGAALEAVVAAAARVSGLTSEAFEELAKN